MRVNIFGLGIMTAGIVLGAALTIHGQDQPGSLSAGLQSQASVHGLLTKTDPILLAQVNYDSDQDTRSSRSRSNRSGRGGLSRRNDNSYDNYGNSKGTYGSGYNSQYQNDPYGGSSSGRRSRLSDRRNRRDDQQFNQIGEQQPQQSEQKTPEKPRRGSSGSGGAGGGGGTAGDSGGTEEISVTGATGQGRQAPAPGQPPAQRQKPAQEKNIPRVANPTLFVQASADPILVDDIVSIEIQLLNPKKVGFDHLEFNLKYDPEVFEFISSSTDDMAILDRDLGSKRGTLYEGLKDSKGLAYYVNEILPDKGTIHYAIDLKDETSSASGVIGVVQLRGVKEARASKISFDAGLSEPNNPTGPRLTSLTLLGKDVLGDPDSPEDGLLDEDIGVITERERALADRTFNREDNIASIYDTHLRIWTPRNQIVLGEEFEVFVELDNPDDVVFDQVALLIAYNPRVLAVIDSDENNAITKGINIHDGSYRDNFSFDYTVLNDVDTDKGLIDYRMRTSRRPLKTEGILASIRFRALRTTQKTTLRLLVDFEAKEPTTGLFYQFTDVLGDSTDPADALVTTSLMIGRVKESFGMASPSIP